MALPVTRERMLDFLRDVPLFGDLDDLELGDLAAQFEAASLPGDAWVFREGDAGDAWYVVFDGEVEVVKEVGTDRRVIAVLGSRAAFGEMAILDGSRRSASVRTTRPTTALKFPRAGFARLLAAGNLGAYKLVHQMALLLVSRQRRTTHRLAELMGLVSEGDVRDGLLPLLDQSSVAE
jgi:CRP-like cAMP-binding protein